MSQQKPCSKLTELEDLSPEQREVVESWGQGLAVLAGAGSGKTTTLTIKCAELLKRNPEARFAAVSFTERSASDLRAKLTQRLSALRDQGVLPPQPNQAGVLAGHWVMTIHGLCSTILREYPREAGFDGEESMLSEPESQLLWERALEPLWLEEDLPPEVREAIDLILARESRDSASDLLKRVRELQGFGILGKLSASSDPAERALATAGTYLLDRYDRLKRRRGALDFNDLERGADRVLEVPEIREALHKRFDLVLVDEFQDTNPVQARILERLVRPDYSNLCVVGDPKQSIYRFRDADVSLFEEFCARLPAQKTLSWNFRSRPGIIDYANALCAPAFEASQMRYDALVPKREPGAFDPVARLDVSSPLELAAWIRGEVDRGVPLHDMALLLRKIRGNEKWLKALVASGIPIAVGSGGLFWEDPRVRECVALLKWWDNPGNTLSGAVFLRAPWMGVEDTVLDRWVREDATWVKPFFSESSQARYPVARALAALRGRIVRPGELLMALLAEERIEAELGSPLLGLWHRAEELSSRGLDFHAVATELAACCEQKRRERDVPPPRNQGQLSVLTLHGSKGLEFPHVILIDLGKKGKAPSAPLLFWDREKGAYLSSRDSDGERDKKDPIESSWRESERSKNLAESKRVFYVALTRAQERLVLACPELAGREDREEKDPPEPTKAFAEDDWRAWVECTTHPIPSLPKPAPLPVSMRVPSDEAPVEAAPPALARLAPPRLTRPRHSVTEWNLLSRCERAYEWTYVRPVAPPSEGALFAQSKRSAGEGRHASPPALEADEPGLSQRELGTRVHACLERGDLEGLRQLEREAGRERFQAEPVIEWARTSRWMRPSDPASGREVWAELAFEAPIPTGPGLAPAVLVGALDRLVRDSLSSGSEAQYAIVDFKITEEPKSDEALIGAYGAQMELYARGLRQLEPDASAPAAILVNISAGSVREVRVPLGRVDADAIAQRAAQIVAGREGAPSPGDLCRYCDFRSVCDAGRASVVRGEPSASRPSSRRRPHSRPGDTPDLFRP
jgi:ATP-dependent helicase/nuclease subunit A